MGDFLFLRCPFSPPKSFPHPPPLWRRDRICKQMQADASKCSRNSYSRILFENTNPNRITTTTTTIKTYYNPFFPSAPARVRENGKNVESVENFLARAANKSEKYISPVGASLCVVRLLVGDCGLGVCWLGNADMSDHLASRAAPVRNRREAER